MADGGNEFGLHPLGPLAFRNVADHRDIALAAGAGHLADGDLGFEQRPVAALAGKFLPAPGARLTRGTDRMEPGLALFQRVAFVHQGHVVLAHHLFGPIPEHPHDTGVHALDNAIAVQQQHPVHRAIEHRAFAHAHAPRLRQRLAALAHRVPDDRSDHGQQQCQTDDQAIHHPHQIQPRAAARHAQIGQPRSFQPIERRDPRADGVHHPLPFAGRNPLLRHFDPTAADIRDITGIESQPARRQKLDLGNLRFDGGGRAAADFFKQAGPLRPCGKIRLQKAFILGDGVATHRGFGIQLHFLNAGKAASHRLRFLRRHPQFARLREDILHQQVNGQQAERNQREGKARQNLANRPGSWNEAIESGQQRHGHGRP